jgi:hypothetical protein
MAGAARFRIASRAARILALLCFLLPFATVSCSSRELNDAFNKAIGPTSLRLSVTKAAPARCTLLQASGLQLALGTAQPSSECIGAAAAFLPERGAQSLASTPLARNDLAMIGAAALIVAALVLGIMLTGPGAVFAGMLAALLAVVAASWSVFVRLPQALHAVPIPRPVPISQTQLGRILEINGGAGFWLMVLALILASIFDVLALHRSKALPLANDTS